MHHNLCTVRSLNWMVQRINVKKLQVGILLSIRFVWPVM